MGGRRKGAGRPPGPAPGPQSLREARRRKQVALADLRELEVAKLRGQLVDADAVVREWTEGLRRIRSVVLAVPSRVRQLVPHLSAADVELLDRELRDALTSLADEAKQADCWAAASQNPTVRSVIAPTRPPPDSNGGYSSKPDPDG
jgi:hypothetical protein